MTRIDIINEVEKAFEVRYSWSKPYGIYGTMLTECGLYYKRKNLKVRRPKNPLAWLQLGFFTADDKVISANISFNRNGERHEFEIEKVEDIAEIIKKVVS